ncbi:MAG: 50S ribosomal protein L15 [Mycoplasma sp.]
MQLHELKYTKGSRNHKSKIVGRGHGSGLGKTSGRGQDGQKSRKSGQVRLAFEGGQTPLYRRLPKVGFNNHNFANEYNVINIKDLNKYNEKTITLEFLLEKRAFPKNNLPLKIIGNGEVASGITIKAHKFSKGALAAIEKSKSKAEIISK